LRGENTVLPPSRLREVLEQCESRLDEANFLQRQRTRYWLLRYFEQQRITNLTGTIVRVDEQRPLVELDGFMTILPFQKAKKVGDFSDRTSSRLGAKISLKVQKISARDDKFYLVEDE
jgi:exoribonuclease R